MNKPPDYSENLKTQLLQAEAADLIADLLISVGLLIEVNKSMDICLGRSHLRPREPP